MKRLSILGSTGSIGCNALRLVDLYPDRFEVVGLAARRNVERLHEQCLRYRPGRVALGDEGAARELQKRLPGVRVLGGVEGVAEIAILEDADLVLSAITGAAGLIPTYRAVEAGKRIALANKEALVMAGDLIMQRVKGGGLTLLPVDSEHSALHQCLRGVEGREVRRLILTASGGPFFSQDSRPLEQVTPQQALNHPTWDMGPKISIDSATLMNKGLEVIEAHHLFEVDGAGISVVIHPQSTVHSMVEFIDGQVLAQMSITDMRSSLLYAFSHPERWDSNLPKLDFFSLPPLEFHPPDLERFPCLRLAYESLARGCTFPTALNAANEVAVHCFLDGRLPFARIAGIIEGVLERHQPRPVDGLDTVLDADREARRAASESIRRLTA